MLYILVSGADWMSRILRPESFKHEVTVGYPPRYDFMRFYQ